MPNRLASEPSPYLLQHAANPVDWYPWGDDAFARARQQDKPIFLSIGYSTCHWCHVMERESFENKEIASVLNEGFVSVKVDREERPDVDRVYMRFVQATTGAGGWPMSVWLTPALKPFYGGTYFPPFARWGRPGFVDVLREITHAWSTDRTRLMQSAETVMERLTSFGGAVGRPGPVADPGALSAGVEQFQQTFDARWGGFGAAPKFPRPSELLFLLREYARTGLALPMIEATLRAMATGGMRDHVGGGFHRYSVDVQWRVPHFEKMLYDQAQLVLAYVEAYQDAGQAAFKTVALDTLAYVKRDMTHSGGGFYSAEDADSVPPDNVGVSADVHLEKREGAFYVWTLDEIEALFADDADVVCARYGVEAGGNATEDPQGEFDQQNILYEARSINDVVRLTGRSASDVAKVIVGARKMLYKMRGARQRPNLDDKVLSGWNGLMIAAFARAARVFECDGRVTSPLLTAAQAAARFVRDALWDGDRQRLLRRYRNGQAAIDGYSEDYAFTIWGLLELFQADFDPDWLEWAQTLQAQQNELFLDAVAGGWFATTGQDPSVLLRLKEDQDGAEPSASSVSVLNLLTLSQLTGDDVSMKLVEGMLGRLNSASASPARTAPLMMAGLSVYHQSRPQVVVVGSRDAADTCAMLAALAKPYMPGMVVVFLEPGVHQSRMAELLPFVRDMVMLDGQATAYVCKEFVCAAPTTDVDVAIAAVGPRPAAGSDES